MLQNLQRQSGTHTKHLKKLQLIMELPACPYKWWSDGKVWWDNSKSTITYIVICYIKPGTLVL